jgi:hypothetical protein
MALLSSTDGSASRTLFFFVLANCSTVKRMAMQILGNHRGIDDSV